MADDLRQVGEWVGEITLTQEHTDVYEDTWDGNTNTRKFEVSSSVTINCRLLRAFNDWGGQCTATGFYKLRQTEVTTSLSGVAAYEYTWNAQVSSPYVNVWLTVPTTPAEPVSILIGAVLFKGPSRTVTSPPPQEFNSEKELKGPIIDSFKLARPPSGFVISGSSQQPQDQLVTVRLNPSATPSDCLKLDEAVEPARIALERAELALRGAEKSLAAAQLAVVGATVGAGLCLAIKDVKGLVACEVLVLRELLQARQNEEAAEIAVRIAKLDRAVAWQTLATASDATYRCRGNRVPTGIPGWTPIFL